MYTGKYLSLERSGIIGKSRDYNDYCCLWILHRYDKYVQLFHTCDRFVRLSNSHEFFTDVTNTFEFVTRLKLDICEEFVRIKISKLVVRICHTCQNVTYSYEFFTCMWQIRSVVNKVQQSLHYFPEKKKIIFFYLQCIKPTLKSTKS